MSEVTTDNLRQTYPRLGFAVYAFTPGGSVTTEVHDPEGRIFAFSGETEEACWRQAFPEMFETEKPEEDVFA